MYKQNKYLKELFNVYARPWKTVQNFHWISERKLIILLMKVMTKKVKLKSCNRYDVAWLVQRGEKKLGSNKDAGKYFYITGKLTEV